MKYKITNNEELKYIMRYFEINQVAIPKNLGKIVLEGNNLTYVTKGYFQAYKPEYQHCAFEDAIKCINEDIEKIGSWKELAKRTFTTRILDEDKRDISKTTPVKGYCWTSDFAKSGVTASRDNEGYIVLEGGVSALDIFLRYANEHLKYCHDLYYRIENEDVNEAIKFFNRYGLQSDNAKAYDYYHIGIVD